MSIFCFKKITPPVRLGQQLKSARLQADVTLLALEQKTRIAEKYLLAIEDNNFAALPPARAYRLAYIREYAAAVGYNPDQATRQMIEENGLRDILVKHPQRGLKRLAPLLTSWLTRGLTIVGLLLIFVGYLAWQIKGVLTPPILNIYAPPDGIIINQTALAVEGVTEKEVHLTINGQDTRADEQGKFNTILNLTNGLNIITFSATKKHGKNTTVTRHVVVK